MKMMTPLSNRGRIEDKIDDLIHDAYVLGRGQGERSWVENTRKDLIDLIFPPPPVVRGLASFVDPDDRLHVGPTVKNPGAYKIEWEDGVGGRTCLRIIDAPTMVTGDILIVDPSKGNAVLYRNVRV